MNNKLLSVAIIGFCCSSVLASPAGQHNYNYDVPTYGQPQLSYQAIPEAVAAYPYPYQSEPALYYDTPTRAYEPRCEFYGNAPLSAIAVLKGDGVEGNITLEQKSCEDHLHVIVKIKGLSAGRHGFHVHEKGDLSGGCGSTGGHYNPDKLDHGDINDAIRHVGDWANVEANEAGEVDTVFTDTVASLYGPRSIIGRAIVVHTGEDDLGKTSHVDSKKTGNAGGRAACGVIGLQ